MNLPSGPVSVEKEGQWDFSPDISGLNVGLFLSLSEGAMRLGMVQFPAALSLPQPDEEHD